jgi:hypothetical protein
VSISLDADASKKLEGTVTQIANVGEQRPNQDSKVFEVKIQVTKADTTLRPGMTTSNAIETAAVPNVLSVPLEAVVTEAGYSFVYKKNGSHVVKQQIETGMTNDNEIVVKQGLTKDDHVLLAPPADKSGISTSTIPGLKPTTAPAVGSDTAKGVSLPAAKTPTASESKKPEAAPKPKG